MVKVKRQDITDRWAIYLGDCVKVLPAIPSESVGFSIFSPPFLDLYVYSEDEADMGNSKTKEEFFEHFRFLVRELRRVLLPGRLVAVHCADLAVRKQDKGWIAQYDFPGDLVRCFEEEDFLYHSRHCIWKDPLVLFMRTKTAGLAHKQIVSDSSLCRAGNPDYVLSFRKKGDNPEPIRHPRGLTEYAGSRPIPRNLDWFAGVNPLTNEPWAPNVNKRSHWIWQQYASPVWFDVRQMRVLPKGVAREKRDDKHVCPLQTDVIERCLTLWSNPGDVVLTPFLGIGSEIWVAVRMNRKGLGIELKESYYKQAVRNLRGLDRESKGFSDNGEE